ncbi:hypothetical protein RU639_010784 [Aspergillus parasiticus]
MALPKPASNVTETPAQPPPVTSKEEIAAALSSYVGFPEPDAESRVLQASPSVSQSIFSHWVPLIDYLIDSSPLFSYSTLCTIGPVDWFVRRIRAIYIPYFWCFSVFLGSLFWSTVENGGIRFFGIMGWDC